MDNQVNQDVRHYLPKIQDDMNKRASKIEEIFTKANKDMSLVKDCSYWTGNTSDIVFEKYDELKQNYDAIIYSLKTLNNFIDGVKDAYIQFDQTIEKNVDDSDLSM